MSAVTDELVAEVFGDQTEVIKRYVDILLTRGVEHGLLGPRESDRIWERHIMNSVSGAELIANGARVADVGSGAGLPGIPLAIRRPDLTVVLIESMERRVRFLQTAVDELGLGDRVRVLRSRAEEVNDTFDVVVCRAVAALDKLLKWTTPLFMPNGELIALKGDRANDEVTQARAALAKSRLVAEVIQVQAHPEIAGTQVVRVSKQR